jgi:hypothetical protein
MAKFRKSQKIFFLPAAANLLGTATSAIFAGSSLVGMKQGKESNELMAQQNAEMERANREQQKIEQARLEQEKKWQEQQLKLQKKALKQGVNPFGQVLNTQGQPTTPPQMDSLPPPPIAQANYSNLGNEEQQKEYSVFSFAKDLGTLAMRNRGIFINGALAGMATTAGVYTVDKAIRENQKSSKKTKEDKEDREEKIFSRKKISFKAPVFSFALGAAAPAISYAAEKKIERDMLQDTTRDYREEDEERKSVPKFKEKSFAAVPNKTLNAISILAGGGGAKGVRNLGIQISAIGKKSGNKATKKLGKAILDNPNTSMILSIPGGMAILGGTFALGDKAATKIAKTLDPDAFGYVESKDEEIEQ